MDFSVEHRAIGCLQGVAVGDAMGKMTEGYQPREIAKTYGDSIIGFCKPIQPRSSFKWKYAEVTDDTRFTLLVAKSIISKRKVDSKDITKRIMRHPIKGWPRWREFCKVMQSGEKAKTDFVATADRNGAPMRVSPIGIINKPENIQKIVLDVESACKMTHYTRSALSAACAIAAAISAALEGWAKEEVIKLAIKASELGEKLGVEDGNPRVSQRIKLGMAIVKEYAGSDLPSFLNCEFNSPGFKAWEGVPYALSMVYGFDNAKDVILGIVNQGEDADSVASMAGGLSTAMSPDTLPREWVETVERINNLNLSRVALKLLELRK
jgi:ADP-ribosylglycohydrolase